MLFIHLTQRDPSPNPRPTSHPNCSLPRTPPAPSPPPPQLQPMPFLSSHVSSTSCSFRCCSELPLPGPSLAQDRVKHLCPGSHHRPCALCFAPTAYLGDSCLHGLLHQTQNRSLCLPSTQQVLNTHAGRGGWRGMSR